MIQHAALLLGADVAEVSVRAFPHQLAEATIADQSALRRDILELHVVWLLDEVSTALIRRRVERWFFFGRLCGARVVLECLVDLNGHANVVEPLARVLVLALGTALIVVCGREFAQVVPGCFMFDLGLLDFAHGLWHGAVSGMVSMLL